MRELNLAIKFGAEPNEAKRDCSKFMLSAKNDAAEVCYLNLNLADGLGSRSNLQKNFKKSRARIRQIYFFSNFILDFKFKNLAKINKRFQDAGLAVKKFASNLFLKITHFGPSFAIKQSSNLTALIQNEKFNRARVLLPRRQILSFKFDASAKTFQILWRQRSNLNQKGLK